MKSERERITRYLETCNSLNSLSVKLQKVDLAKTMAEMFHKADANKDEVMDLKEFKTGVMDHPVTAKIFQIKKIDAILELM